MELLWIALLGGLLGLDTTGVGQFMVSRPLVAGLLAGALLGDPALGVGLGVILELYLLVSVPSGGARFPEGSTATIVAVASAAPFGTPGALALAAAVGLVWGQVSGLTVTALRHVNSRIVPEPGRRRASPGTVTRVQLLAIAIDFLRASSVTVAGVLVGRTLVPAFASHWPLDPGSSIGLLLIGGAVSAGILLHDLGGFRRRYVWFLAGLGMGLLGSRFL